ncbi:glycosyltransferase family 2 protein [Glaciecola punicea]|uniref:glycosyltransferase family 2 protein n=1 Tax=Glaciecola punicea TaxID=56804 RepID=UPI001495DD0E|nr:glycosyltransferase family 2 protein [Glaciecola punicea]
MVRQSNSPDDKFDTVLFLAQASERIGEGGLRTKGYFKVGREASVQSGSEQHLSPLITVITVVFNGESFLEKAILSVINQTYDNVEYVIIDGGSTDNTLNIIRKYEHLIDYWVSEKDNGIYDAMNKGLQCSTGGYIGFLNSDDYMYSTSLESYANELSSFPADLYFSSVDLVNEHEEYYARFQPIKHFFFANVLIRMPFAHQTVYLNKKVLKAEGGFNLNYKLSADFELVYRLLKKNYKTKNVNVVFGAFRDGGLSGDIYASLKDSKLVVRDKTNLITSNIWYGYRIIRSVIGTYIFKKVLKKIRTKS